MPCPQVPLLLAHKIMVDTFTQRSDAVHYFLSHPHADHLKNLSPTWKGGTIYCSQITKDLLLMQMAGLDSKRLEVIPFHRKIKLTNDIEVVMFPSHHCDGGSMFWFHLKSAEEYILCSTDFRMHPKMLDHQFFLDMPITKFYFDDTFYKFNIPFPSRDVSAHHLQKMLDENKSETFMIDASMLGVEPLLRKIKTNYRLSEHLKNSVRGNQLRYLLPGRIDEEKDSVLLGTKRKDNLKAGKWIMPTATKFLCKKPYEKDGNIWYVFWATHSNVHEIRLLNAILQPKEVISCDMGVKTLRC